jgi:hypothetical protein
MHSAEKLFHKDVAALKLLPQAAAKMFMALPESAFGINKPVSTSHTLQSKKSKRVSTNALIKSDLDFLLPKKLPDQAGETVECQKRCAGRQHSTKEVVQRSVDFSEARAHLLSNCVCAHFLFRRKGAF